MLASLAGTFYHTTHGPEPARVRYSGGMVLGAFAGVCCNQPLDVVRNRLYNQPIGADGQGTLYAGAIDCAKQLLRNEGPLGLYRGFSSHYLRVGPHYVLTFTFLEQIKKALGA